MFDEERQKELVAARVAALDAEEIGTKEKCPKCGRRGFFVAIGLFWIFKCGHCGHKASNTKEASC
jgi:uncharacterized protein (DUF983 family)